MRYLTIVFLSVFFVQYSAAQSQNEIETAFCKAIKRFVNIDSINRTNDERIYFIKRNIPLNKIAKYYEFVPSPKIVTDSFLLIGINDTLRFVGQKMYTIEQRDSISNYYANKDVLISPGFRKYMMEKGVADADYTNPKYEKEFDVFLEIDSNADLKRAFYLYPTFLSVYPVIKVGDKVICGAYYEKRLSKWAYQIAAVFEYKNGEFQIEKIYRR